MFDDEEIEYDNCPVEFRNNCTFQTVKCFTCKAFNSEHGSLHYREILRDPDLQFKKHPCFQAEKLQKKNQQKEAEQARRQSQSFKTAQQNVRTGRKVEQKVLAQSNAQSTKGSGAVYGDGDGFLTLPGGNRVYIEHKARIANRQTLGPTQAEWDKAKQQGVEIFMVTSETNGTLVTMSQQTFNALIEVFKN